MKKRQAISVPPIRGCLNLEDSQGFACTYCNMCGRWDNEKTIKKHKKIYACGYCGAPCYKNGEYIGYIPDDYNPDNYDKAGCTKCGKEQRSIDIGMRY